MCKPYISKKTALKRTISCGFDAGEHEDPNMRRHACQVPTSLYERFPRDVQSLADVYGGGKIVSVLEGGYSDLALISGGMAHVAGLAYMAKAPVIPVSLWDMENLRQVSNIPTVE
jgi:histone deacetylase HOS3